MFMYVWSQFLNWRVREMARLKRDAEAREVAAIDKADLERRRKMTDHLILCQ
jgi:hypothetical protein